jgi:ribosomal protein S21
VGLSMAMSALCSVASVVRILPRSSVETSSSTGDSTVATSISRSSSVKLPPLVAQQQQVSAAGKSLAASSSVEMTIVDPSLQYANLMWFRGSYNAQVFVGEDEPADSVVRRFRKAVMMAGVIPECRRRRFFETPQDIVKRKQQNARRKKPRRFTGPRPEGFGEKKEGGRLNANDDDDDFWGFAQEGADVNL